MRIEKNSLTGRIAVVTGAGSGLGKATAKALAYAGAAVGLIGRTLDELEITRKDIDRNGGEAMALVADISQNADLQGAMGKIREKWGRLDVVHANAGINGVWASLEQLEEKDWDQTLNVNLKGTFLTIKQALPLMKQHGGSIIVTASVNGTRIFSNTGATAYSCSKAAQVALTKMLALELAHYHIRVNVICPGWIESKIDDSTKKQALISEKVPVEFPAGVVPLTEGAPGTAGQVAQLVWFLASPASSHITGTEIYIDGGQSLLQG